MTTDMYSACMHACVQLVLRKKLHLILVLLELLPEHFAYLSKSFERWRALLTHIKLLKFVKESYRLGQGLQNQLRS
jgi:hypothetical protein